MIISSISIELYLNRMRGLPLPCTPLHNPGPTRAEISYPLPQGKADLKKTKHTQIPVFTRKKVLRPPSL